MSEQFKVGDICIGQNFVKTIERNGQECEIIESLEERECWDSDPSVRFFALTYQVRWEDGSKRRVAPSRLRKKQPPRSAKSIMRAAILKAQQPVKVPA